MAEQPEPNLESVPSAYGRQVSNRRPQVHVGGSFLHMSGERLGAVTSQEKCKTCMNSVYMANFMALVVLIDAVCTVADIDATAQQQQSGDLVQVISDLCLTAYSLEVLGLLYLYGFHLLKDWMMLLDVVIVVCGWGEKILAAAIASSLGFRISVLRALRLVRIFRLMRLLKRIRPLRDAWQEIEMWMRSREVHRHMDTRHICCWMGRRSTKELHKLVMMMATCLRTLLWSFMLCFVVMTVWAMLMVETIHPSLEEMYLADELGSCDTQCIRSMSSVMDANLLIFKTVIAGDSWGEIAVPVIQKHPGTAIIFVGSLLTLVFGVLNLIVAVVVDTFADARLNDVQNLAEEMEDEIEHDRKALAKLFARIDKDGSGQLTLQEMIEGARQDPGFQSRLRVMDIDEHDLEQLFQMIDRDQSGTIEVAEFIGPLSRWAHDSKTAPRFIKYHMLQTMQMQEDLWELSVECFNQLNTKIEALAGRMAGEYPAAEGPPKSREMSFEGAAPSEEVMTHIGSLDSRASQGSHITETMMSMDVSGNVKVQLDGFDSVLSPSASPVVTKETAPREMLDQPKASPDPDLWAPKSTEQQFREKSSVLEGLLESAMSKLEGKLVTRSIEEDLLLESRGRRHELLASPEGHNALSEAIGKPKSKKKGKILHPEAFRNMYMDRGKRLSLIPPPPSSPPSSGDPSPGCFAPLKAPRCPGVVLCIRLWDGQDKPKDTVLIKDLGLVAACVNSEILRMHAMKDLDLLRALEELSQRSDTSEEVRHFAQKTGHRIFDVAFRREDPTRRDVVPFAVRAGSEPMADLQHPLVESVPRALAGESIAFAEKRDWEGSDEVAERDLQDIRAAPPDFRPPPRCHVGAELRKSGAPGSLETLHPLDHWMEEVHCERHPWLSPSAMEPSPEPLLPETFSALMQSHAQSKFFQVLMNVVASEIKVGGLRLIRAALQRYDRHGSGYIAAPDLEAVFHELSVSAATSEQALRALDVAGTGQISYTLFMAGCVDLVDDKLDHMLWKVFSMVDEDCTGEMETLVPELGVRHRSTGRVFSSRLAQRSASRARRKVTQEMRAKLMHAMEPDSDMNCKAVPIALKALRPRGYEETDREAFLVSQVSLARQRRQLLESPDTPRAAPSFLCPAPGAGVPEGGVYETEIEKWHFQRHQMWAEDQDLCHRSFGLWTRGGSLSCPLRYAVIGNFVGLAPGDLVLDIGSGCGHMGAWFHDWFGARTIGLDFQPAAVAFAQKYVVPVAPTQFCWMDVASQLGDWLPNRSVKLATAISVSDFLSAEAAEAALRRRKIRFKGSLSRKVEGGGE
ncbi:unnamed protein product [Durusdinium trenchii]|uniref:EF-hand domain-containing protein n=1 Tax=Durusdinium trenchii TaxID=1381693 RepID=A0ABP0NAZ7_9DINO